MESIKLYIEKAIRQLGSCKKIFQNESDFVSNVSFLLKSDKELAQMDFRNEYVDKLWLQKYSKNGILGSREKIDLMIFDANSKEHFIIEFKYKTQRDINYCSSDGLSLPILSNRSYNIGKLDICDDMHRIEKLKNIDKTIKKGYVVFLTNVNGYFSKSSQCKREFDDIFLDLYIDYFSGKKFEINKKKEKSFGFFVFEI